VSVVPVDELRAWLAAVDAGGEVPAELVRDAVRATLKRFAAKVPGRSVEVRVPPWGAVQCVPGTRHTRGTPGAVVEVDPTTWLELASGRESFAAAVHDGRVRASGERSDLSPWLPL
jgi:hypothetical protein